MAGGTFKLANNGHNKAKNSQIDLMSESYSRRSWKGIACALLVIAACAAIIAVIVVYAGPSRPAVSPQTLKLEDVVTGKFYARSFNGTWVTDTKFVYTNQDKDILAYDVLKQTTTVLALYSLYSTISEGPVSFKVSPDLNYILFYYKITPEYRYSFTARYKTYDVISKDIQSLADDYILQFADWGPKSKQLVYVKNNNIYYKESVKSVDKAIPVTNDGVDRVVYNGVPDWVYEEEVLASDHALYWSKSGSKLAFIKFNDSKVSDMPFIEYGSPMDLLNVYSTVYKIKYPKPGLTNPTVTVYVVDFEASSSPMEVLPPPEISQDHYVVSVTWSPDDVLYVSWVPRLQNHLIVSACRLARFSTSSWQCKKNSEITTNGWIYDYTPPLFTPDGSAYFLVKAYNDNYRQLVMINANDGSEMFLTNTSSTAEVSSILGYDHGKSLIYFSRFNPNNPATAHVFYASVNTTGPAVCLTCDLDYECGYYGASLSSANSLAAIQCYGGYAQEYAPWTEFRSLPDNKFIRKWETNEEFKQRISNETLCNFKNLSVPINGGFTANVQLYMPKDFDSNRRYPLVIEVYGGPGTSAVKNYHSIDFGTYVASVNKYLYAKIDGRGSSGRGHNLMFQIYKGLGGVEVQDQIDVARFMSLNLSYVDPTKLAIWGWSYGGFAAASALVDGNDTFKCALSVAPVTSWYYYDSVYTERFMLTPDQNMDNYKASDLMFKATKFRDNKFILLHGTADDNVHFQQSMMLTKALNRANVMFDMHVYPDENHSLGPSKYHVYKTLDSFINQCFA